MKGMYIMQRRFRTGVTLIFIFLAAAAVYAAGVDRLPGRDGFVPVSALTEDAELSGYVLRLEGGELGVYDTGGRMVLSTGISAPELRQSDRKILEKGISAGSYEEILALLEDFNS